MLESGKSISRYLPPNGIEPIVRNFVKSMTLVSLMLAKIKPNTLLFIPISATAFIYSLK